MDLPVRKYMQRYSRCNKAHRTTVYRLLAWTLRFILILYSVLQNIKFHIWAKIVTDSNRVDKVFSSSEAKFSHHSQLSRSGSFDF